MAATSRALAALTGLALATLACGAPAPASTREQPAVARTAEPAATAALAPAPTEAPRPTPELAGARFSTSGWKTDFTKASVPFDEISSGGPPRDGIPPIDKPTFEAVAQADGWLKPVEPVIELRVGAEARAYPLQVLIWHEIVNDEVASSTDGGGGVPVSVTFCPLCNSAIVFDRRLDGRVLDFGTTGNLRHSDLVMWDRQTESWWQQVTGEAIVGELNGRPPTAPGRGLANAALAHRAGRQEARPGRAGARDVLRRDAAAGRADAQRLGRGA